MISNTPTVKKRSEKVISKGLGGGKKKKLHASRDAVIDRSLSRSLSIVVQYDSMPPA
jgi:hypothetical protein